MKTTESILNRILIVAGISVAGSVPALSAPGFLGDLGEGSETTTQTKTLFAPGVTKESGWYDANKAFNDQDSSLCWAATAANAIAWWKDNYEDGGGVLDSNLSRTEDEIFKIFQDHWVNEGENNASGVGWYFTGKFSSGKAPDTLEVKNSGGYLTHIEGVGTSAWNLINGSWQHWGNQETGQVFINDMTRQELHPGCERFSKVIIDQLSKGVAMISVRGAGQTASTAGHSITLWGCEYDETTNLITKVYVTDSDDHYDGLKSYSIVDLNGEAIMDGYTYGTFNNGIITNSSMLYASFIPEPSAFGLLAGTFALGLCAVRRRRK